MDIFDYYDVVGVRATADAVKLGVANSRGIILSKPEEDDNTYAVFIGEIVYVLDGSALIATGEKVSPEAVMTGESIRVAPEGADDEPADG